MNICPADIDTRLAAVCCYLSAWPPCWRGQDPLNVFISKIFYISHPVSVALDSTLPWLFSNKPAKWEVDWINVSGDMWRTDRQIIVRIVSSLMQHRRCERHPAFPQFPQLQSLFQSLHLYLGTVTGKTNLFLLLGCNISCIHLFSWGKKEVNMRFIVNSW